MLHLGSGETAQTTTATNKKTTWNKAGKHNNVTKRSKSLLQRKSEVEAEQGSEGIGAWIVSSWTTLWLLWVINVLFCVTSLVCLLV